MARRRFLLLGYFLMRIINISAGHLNNDETDADKWEKLHNQCGGSDEPIRKALGYLSLWNWSTFPYVDITLMGDENNMELIANYRKEPKGNIGYSIGAVWYQDHFGFHS